MSGLEIAAVVCLAFWVGLSLDRSRAWPREAVLPQVEAESRERSSDAVIAVVPARNEETTLPRTLPSLLQQDPIDLLVVADDGSDDATSRVVRGLDRNSERGTLLRWVEVPEPPPRWSGKVHAIAFATAALSGLTPDRGTLEHGWWLFSDADIELGPGRVEALLARAESEEQGGPFDLVSVMARLHCGSFWEKLLIPPFVFFFQLLYPFRRVRDARSSVAAAAGGCILVRRRAYRAAGGHAAIRGALIDDVALAKLVKGRGGRVWLGLDRCIRSIRPYQRLGDLWRMVERSAFVQLRYRVDLLILVILGLGLFVLAPPVLIGMAARQVVASGVPPDAIGWRTLAWASLAWALQARALLPSVLHHRIPAVYCLTLPVAGVLYGLMTLSSAWGHLSGRGQRWRGRSYTEAEGGDPS